MSVRYVDSIEVLPQDSKAFEQGLRLTEKSSLIYVNNWRAIHRDKVEATSSEDHDQALQLLLKIGVNVNAQGADGVI